MKRDKIVKVVVILMPLILVASIVASIFLFLHVSDNRKNLSDDMPILVPYTRKIPKIDGIVGRGEWDDTIFYSYHTEGKKNGLLGMKCVISANYIPTKMKIAMKDDGHWLYTLVIVDDDKENENDAVVIYTEKQHIYSLLPDWGIFFFHNGTALKCNISLPPQRDITKEFENYKTIANCSKLVNATFSSRYTDKTYIFEIKLSMNHLDLNKTNGYAPFVLVYLDSDKNINSISTFSGSYSLSPGIKLIGELPEENRYYIEIGDTPPDYLAWFIVTEEAIVIAYISILLFKTIRKSQSDKNE